jgi:hypothetical protein
MQILAPALMPDQLYPPDAVYMARTRLEHVRMLGYTALQLDSATSILPGLLNGRASVRHIACSGDEVLELFAAAGIRIDETIHCYATEQEAMAHARALVAAGKRLFWPYPLPEGLCPAEGHLVSPELYRILNAKQNLCMLVSAEHRAYQHALSHKQFSDYSFSAPVCLKAGGDAATGWGYAVFPCHEPVDLEVARGWFAQREADISCVLIEEWIDVACSWCVGLAVSEKETLCFGGAEQLFANSCKQSGSLVDSNHPIPQSVETLALLVGEKARLMGFLGIAGLDIGMDKAGRAVLFDPNFRVASSSAQLLFHPAAARRSGLPVSRSVQINPDGRFDQIAARLRGPTEEGWFVPTRIFNGEKHPLSGGRHIVTGFVLGQDRCSALETVERLSRVVQR